MSLVDTDYAADPELIARILDGSLVRDKARLLVGFLGLKRLSDILKDEKAAASTIMDAIKLGAQLGDLNPKALTPAVSTTPLQINISLPTGMLPQPGAFRPDTVDTPMAPTMVLDMTPIAAKTAPLADPDPLPPMPAYLKVPDFITTRDLVGPQLPQAPR